MNSHNIAASEIHEMTMNVRGVWETRDLSFCSIAHYFLYREQPSENARVRGNPALITLWLQRIFVCASHATGHFYVTSVIQWKDHPIGAFVSPIATQQLKLFLGVYHKVLVFIGAVIKNAINGFVSLLTERQP